MVKRKSFQPALSVIFFLDKKGFNDFKHGNILLPLNLVLFIFDIEKSDHVMFSSARVQSEPVV